MYPQGRSMAKNFALREYIRARSALSSLVGPGNWNLSTDNWQLAA
jgi:hypothetical protein